VLPRVAKLALALAVATSIGLHWAFFQSVAWVGMVVSYSQDAPLRQALAKTFDGKHPCALCKQITKGRQSERKSDSPPAGKKFEFSYSAASFVFAAPSYYWEANWPSPAGTLLPQTPPVPPPRQIPG